jgi:hypothetical protein
MRLNNGRFCHGFKISTGRQVRLIKIEGDPFDGEFSRSEVSILESNTHPSTLHLIEFAFRVLDI